MHGFRLDAELGAWFDEELTSRTSVRPIFSLHKYFARRSGRIFNWVISELEDSDNQLVVLDPMAGGGTIPWEAMNRGHHAIAADLNPLASLIHHGMFNPPHPSEYRKAVGSFLDIAQKELADMFYTDRNGTNQPFIYRHFIRIGSCPACACDQPLYPHTLLNRGRTRGKPQNSKNKGDNWCPSCFSVNHSDSTQGVECKDCGFAYDAESGSIRKERRHSVVECGKCGHVGTAVDFMRLGSRLN